MNKERILALADKIENLPDGKFSMASWVRGGPGQKAKSIEEFHCNTAGCCAGWTLLTFPDEEVVSILNEYFGYTRYDNPTDRYIRQKAAKILELNDFDSEALFLPQGVALTLVTNRDAVNVLRNFAETGVIDWSQSEGWRGVEEE